MFPAYLHINNLVVKKVPARAAGIEEAGEEGGKPYLLPGTQLWGLSVFEKKVKIFSGRNWAQNAKEVIPPIGYDLLISYGRSDWIRTSDPLLPKQVRYQTAPRSVAVAIGESGRLGKLCAGRGAGSRKAERKNPAGTAG